MGFEATKLELIEWLTSLQDSDTIEYLKLVKDSKSTDKDWWLDLSDAQKQRIEKGLKDIEEGKVVPHEQVKKKYGL